MVIAALLALTLASTAEPSGEPPPVFNVAAPGLSAADVDKGKADFLNDYLAEKLMKHGAGSLRVITANEVSAVLGNERQRALLGCADGASCLAELAGALGSDAVVVGNMARFGKTYAVTLKVVSAKDASTLASVSVRDLAEDDLPGWIESAAEALAHKLVPDLGARPAVSKAGGDVAVVPASTTSPAVSASAKKDGRPTEKRYQHSIWLSLASIEYDYRLRGDSWIGVRVTPAAWNTTASLYGQGALVARFHPIKPGQGFNYSLYLGLGAALGSINVLYGDPALNAFLGGELGYKVLRVSAEMVAFSTVEGVRYGITPALSLAFPF